MKSRMSIEIDRPIEEVFAFTTTRVVEWSTIVVEDTVLEEAPGMVGTTFRTVTEERGRRMTFEGRVTQHDPPSLHAVSMIGKQFDLEVAYRFESLGGSTRVTQDTVVEGKGLVKVVFLLFGWLMAKSGCDAAREELANLKRLVESA